MPFGVMKNWHHRVVDGREEKYCGGCQTWFALTADNFGRNKTKRDGFQSWCKPCMRKLCKPKSAEQWARKVRELAARWKKEPS